MHVHDRVRGCLLGGAIGDALRAAVAPAADGAHSPEKAESLGGAWVAAELA
ncbi:hypothetical protein ACFLIM_32205 [Nonomuraea sp. M3C6]|uniref:ADP-ribosylglycohydrolase n=1 Tax=Nonomuraea marmarensis TaxID=3351344 RepID=A0ABW7AKK2_9ACTN